MYSIKNVEELENLNESVSLQNQVNEVRLQDKSGKQNFQENMTKLYAPFFDTIKNTSEDITKSITETSIKINKALKHSNEKVLELINDKGMIAPYLASSLVILLKPEYKSQFKIIKDHSSNETNDFLINGVYQLVYIAMC